MTTVVLFALALLSLALVPIAPRLVRLRVRFFRWLRWNWAVRVLEEHFETWVVFFRAVLLALAVVLFLAGLESAMS
jgi:hypothetical protein